MELSDTNLYSVTQYQVINGIIIRPLHFWRQILFQNLNRLVVCAAHIAYRRLNHQERSCSDQKRSRAASFLLCTHCSRQYSPSAGREIAFYGGLVGVKYAPSTECVFACFGGGEGTCTPVPPYGQMPFYACSLRIGFPPKQVRKQTSRRGNAL